MPTTTTTTTTTEMKHNTSALCSGNIIAGVQFRLAWRYEANFQVSSAMMPPLLLGNDAILLQVLSLQYTFHILVCDFEINIASVKCVRVGDLPMHLLVAERFCTYISN
uniref:Uncharacterized protein n=1 Tax=Glossina austeni TaxID=7395 RepID=A0A1A9UCS8_GLOAU